MTPGADPGGILITGIATPAVKPASRVRAEPGRDPRRGPPGGPGPGPGKRGHRAWAAAESGGDDAPGAQHDGLPADAGETADADRAGPLRPLGEDLAGTEARGDRLAQTQARRGRAREEIRRGAAGHGRGGASISVWTPSGVFLAGRRGC